MAYLQFALLFCVLSVVFEWAWVLVSLVLFQIFSIPKSESISAIGMAIDKIFYCLIFIVLTFLCINHFKQIDNSLQFTLTDEKEIKDWLDKHIDNKGDY